MSLDGYFYDVHSRYCIQIYQKLASFPLNCFSKLYPGLVRGTSFKNLQNKLQIFGTDNGSYRRRGWWCSIVIEAILWGRRGREVEFLRGSSSYDDLGGEFWNGRSGKTHEYVGGRRGAETGPLFWQRRGDYRRIYRARSASSCHSSRWLFSLAGPFYRRAANFHPRPVSIILHRGFFRFAFNQSSSFLLPEPHLDDNIYIIIYAIFWILFFFLTLINTFLMTDDQGRSEAWQF